MHSEPAEMPGLSQTLPLVQQVIAMWAGQGRRRMMVPGLRLLRERGEGIFSSPAERGFCSCPARPAYCREGLRSAA